MPISLRLSFLFGVLAITSCLSRHPVDETESDVSSYPALIECHDDAACPRGSYCEPGLAVCFTGTRCYVDGLPSDAYCQRTFGDDFICYEYATDSYHCVPTE